MIQRRWTRVQTQVNRVLNRRLRAFASSRERDGRLPIPVILRTYWKQTEDPMKDEFWEDSEVVEQFAAREPDHRLSRLISQYDDPGSIRVLDLGCAAGRNAVFLVEHDFDVYAVDASLAMVEKTRQRMTPIVGPWAFWSSAMRDLRWDWSILTREKAAANAYL